MNNPLYILVSITLLTLGGVVAVVYLGRLPNASLQTTAMVLGFLSPTIVSLLAMLKSVKNGNDIHALSIRVDGRLDQLLASKALTATLAERALGVEKAADLIKSQASPGPQL